MTLNTIEHVQSAIFTDHQGNEVQLPIQQAPHTMTEEVAAFANMIKKADRTLYQSWIMMRHTSMTYFTLCARMLALDLRQKNENQTTYRMARID